MADLFDDKNISPMLLYQTQPFDSDEYIFELKLDGIRCIAYIDDKSVTLQNKRFKDVTDIYPELANMNKCVKARCILDGELVLMSDGAPDFFGLQARSLMSDKLKIQIAAKRNPVQFVAYDILYLKNNDVTQKTLLQRKLLLQNNVTEGNNLSISRFVEGRGREFFNLAKKNNLEGVVAKKKDSLYHIGKRSHDWLKIKVLQEEDFVICGYQKDDDGKVKDLILGSYDDGRLVFRAKIFFPVSKQDQKTILSFAKNHQSKNPFDKKFENCIFITPQLVGTVKYMSKTTSGSMRQPVWKGLRDDKDPKDCTLT